jgi:hypothetical protein
VGKSNSGVDDVDAGSGSSLFIVDVGSCAWRAMRDATLNRFSITFSF